MEGRACVAQQEVLQQRGEAYIDGHGQAGHDQRQQHCADDGSDVEAAVCAGGVEEKEQHGCQAQGANIGTDGHSQQRIQIPAWMRSSS